MKEGLALVCLTLAGCLAEPGDEHDHAALEESGDWTVPWDLVVVVLDGANRRTVADIPVAEAVRFIEARSRIRIRVTTLESNVAHSYTGFDCAEGTCVVMHPAANVATSVLDSLPVASSYLFLYELDGRPPLQGGSTWGVSTGIWKGGVQRPTASVPVDIWWYKNEPNQGFRSWAASILAHEIVNTIQCKTEVAPYWCAPLSSTSPGNSAAYEADRLSKLTDDCQARLGAVAVTAGSYGQNCGAAYGNTTAHLAAVCNGLRRCNYQIDHQVIGDPAVGCPKDYVAEWSCGGEVRRVTAAPEAGFGSVVTLECP